MTVIKPIHKEPFPEGSFLFHGVNKCNSTLQAGYGVFYGKSSLGKTLAQGEGIHGISRGVHAVRAGFTTL